MLIEFSVTNFRSFRDKQTLSMVAAPRLRKRENTFPAELSGEKFPNLLKAAVIYGPNASGKSNLLRAMDVISNLCRKKTPDDGEMTDIVPFRFDPKFTKEPSEFDVHFIYDGMRYQFILAVTSTRVVKEALFAFPNSRESLLYCREYKKNKYNYEYGRLLRTECSNGILDTWEQLTPPSLLYITQAVANSSEQLVQLRKPLQWLSRKMNVITHASNWMSVGTQQLVRNHPKEASKLVSEFLTQFDVPISHVSVGNVERNFKTAKEFNEAASTDLDSFDEYRKELKKKTRLTHTTALGDFELSFEDESEGTQNLFGFWLMWASFTPNGHTTMVLDELDTSLHPVIVAELVKKHISQPTPTQLIFTTHDTHLMDTKLLRRDQIWLTERDANGATQLRSVHDFEGRESEDIEKRYYEGRYRAIPLTKRG